MSQTVANRPSQLKAKEVKSPLKIDTYSATNSTKGSPGLNSISPNDYRCTLSTEDPEDYTAQDIAELNVIGQELSHEIVHKVDYEQDMAQKREFLVKTMASNLPLAIKIKMLESTMEGLQTNINCVKEGNQAIKDKILQTQKSSIQKPIKEAPPAKDPLPASKQTTASRTSIGKTPLQSKPTTSAPVKATPTPVKSQPQPVLTEAEKQLQEVTEETKRLEETIAQLKQTRNTLTVTIEDTRDDIEDIQALLKEKKDSLDRKTFYAEDLKQRISKKSSKRSTSSASGTHHKKTNSAIGIFSSLRGNNGSKTNLDKTLDQSTSRVNTSALQEMGSKIGNVFGKMGKVFGMKRGDTSDQILTTDFLRELDNQSTPASLNNSMVQPSQRTMNLSMSNFNFK